VIQSAVALVIGSSGPCPGHRGTVAVKKLNNCSAKNLV